MRFSRSKGLSGGPFWPAVVFNAEMMLKFVLLSAGTQRPVDPFINTDVLLVEHPQGRVFSLASSAAAQILNPSPRGSRQPLQMSRTNGQALNLGSFHMSCPNTLGPAAAARARPPTDTALGNVRNTKGPITPHFYIMSCFY